MKKLLDLVIRNKYYIIVTGILFLGLKFIFEFYDIPQNYFPLLVTFKTIFLILYIPAAIVVLSFFVFALVSKSKRKAWWEKPENQQKEFRKEKRAQIYLQFLTISLPLFIYGSLIYLAIFQTWKTIFTLAITYTATRLIIYFQANQKKDFRRNINGIR